LDIGSSLLSRLYAYRACSRAIPQVQSNEDPGRKQEMYRRTFEVLKPEIDKMKDFMFFRDQAVQLVCDTIASVVPEYKDSGVFPSTEFLVAVAQVLDMFVVMDSMKNLKGSMNNDFSMYKR